MDISIGQISNTFSSGGGGVHYEVHVQAMFLILLMTGGPAPGLPMYPIQSISMQTRSFGYYTDDILITAHAPESDESFRLLVQCKYSLHLRSGDPEFTKSIISAWLDYKNQNIFTHGKDAIALITASIHHERSRELNWILDQAKCTENSRNFLEKIEGVSSQKQRAMFLLLGKILKNHENTELHQDELHGFLKHLYLLECDLGKLYGMNLTLIYSHLSQIKKALPSEIWGQAVDIALTFNQSGGTITRDNLPSSFSNYFNDFSPQSSFNVSAPDIKEENPSDDLKTCRNLGILALLSLIGSWSEINTNDMEFACTLCNLDESSLIKLCRDILHKHPSLIAFHNGVWKIKPLESHWQILGNHLFNEHLVLFRELSVNVLRKTDHTIESSTTERLLAQMDGAIIPHSKELRTNIAESLAQIGNQQLPLPYCSVNHDRITAIITIREIFEKSDWQLWATLGRLLPILAEAAPTEFLRQVETLIMEKPSSIREMTIPSDSYSSRAHMAGVLWALETLAWDEQHLVRICHLLAQLSILHFEGNSGCHPLSTLCSIINPTYPQTRASFKKQEDAVQGMFKEVPDTAKQLLLSFFHRGSATIYSNNRPQWNNPVEKTWEPHITYEQYWHQLRVYGNMLLEQTGTDIIRIGQMIKIYGELPIETRSKLRQRLNSRIITTMTEEKKSYLWQHLHCFISEQKFFSQAKWTISTRDLLPVEKLAKKLTPNRPSLRYAPLFCSQTWPVRRKDMDSKQCEKLADQDREQALKEILNQEGITPILRFIPNLNSPSEVGYSLGKIGTMEIDSQLLPACLDRDDSKMYCFIRYYIVARRRERKLLWLKSIDATHWTPQQKATFCRALPFDRTTWSRVQMWLPGHEEEYWHYIDPNTSGRKADRKLSIALLLKWGRPCAAIFSLLILKNDSGKLNIPQAIELLRAAANTREEHTKEHSRNILKLISILQKIKEQDKHRDLEELWQIEWMYFDLLTSNNFYLSALNQKLSEEPSFYSEMIFRQMRSNKEKENLTQEQRDKIGSMAHILTNYHWTRIPGTQTDSTFDPEFFAQWQKNLSQFCSTPELFNMAHRQFGRKLAHAPADPNGLWIHQSIADMLNDPDNQELRKGFFYGILDSRGCHDIDPTGKQEDQLAQKYLQQAEIIENVGYVRIAVTLRDVTTHYENEARRVRAQYKKDDSL